MDKVEMAIITEIGNEEIRDILLEEHRKNIPKMPKILKISNINNGVFPLFECFCPVCKWKWISVKEIEKRCPSCNQALMY